MKTLRGKKILIRVDGSRAIGLGHIYRMKALAASLSQVNCSVAFLTNMDNVANRLLEAMAQPCHVFHTDSYNAILPRLIEEWQPDLIIQDILTTSPEKMSFLRQLTSAPIINLDDVGAGLHSADVVVNSIVFHWKKHCTNDNIAHIFEGPEYMILQPTIRRYRHAKKNADRQVAKLLLAFGGTDTHGVTERVLAAVNQTAKPLTVTVNLGPGAEMRGQLKRTLTASPHVVKPQRASRDLFGQIVQSDLVICGGGNMLHELAYLGIPSVSIATEPHEVPNIRYWSQVGSTLGLGWEQEMNFSQITEVVERLVDDEEGRAKMSLVGRQAVDGRGLERFLDIMERVLK